MLGSHPQLYGFPELILFNAPTLGAVIAPDVLIQEVDSKERVHAGLYRAISQINEGIQTKESLARAFDWVNEHLEWTVAQVFDLLLEGISPLIGIEKSPESSFSHGGLSRMHKLYPRARFIHLTRHPIPSIRSMQQHWQGRRWWPNGPDRPGANFCAQTWRDTHRRIDAFLEGLPDELHLRVRSEDLLDPHSPELNDTVTWLGLQSDETALTAMHRPEQSPFAGPGPEGYFGGLDPTFLVAPVLRSAIIPSSVLFPKEWNVDPWVQADIALLAAELGYSDNLSKGLDK